MTVPNYFTDTGHWQVAGGSGSKVGYGGKTTTCNAYHSAAVSKGWFDQSVFFDNKGKSSIQGVTCRSVPELQRAYDRGERLFHYVPAGKGESDVDSVYYDFLLKLPGRSLVFWDEFHDYDNSERLALDDAVRKGGNEPQIKSVCIAQRLTDGSTDVRSQLHTTVWAGPPTGDLQAYCRQNPDTAAVQGKTYYNVVRDMHTEPFMWSVFDSDTATTYDPVPEGYA